MTKEPVPDSWPTLAAFYLDDLRRARSHELPLGSLWQTSAVELPWWASWLEATGEVVAVRHPGPESPTGPVEVLAVVGDRATVEIGLRGWWRVCGFPGALPWLRHRAAEIMSGEVGLRRLTP